MTPSGRCFRPWSVELRCALAPSMTPVRCRPVSSETRSPVTPVPITIVRGWLVNDGIAELIQATTIE